MELTPTTKPLAQPTVKFLSTQISDFKIRSKKFPPLFLCEELTFSCCRIVELARKKKAKMNNSEKEVKTEADSSSSDHPCPLALVTASNVRKATQCRERRPPTSPSQKQFMKLKLAHDSLIRGRQVRLITLVGKDGVKWKVNLKEEGSGSALCLGTGWKEFAKANGLKTGDYFTLESAWKNEIPMLSLVNTESASDRKERGESSKAMEKERSTDTSSIVQNRVVTLALETKDVKACTLNLPSEFVTAIGIKKLGKITFLGKDGMKWWGCLLSGNGSVAVGIGWRNFCEANGVKLGESFSLVLINEEEDTGPIFKFCPNSGN
ncbi:hypothetical protein YC2023_054403 [Brassica napus]